MGEMAALYAESPLFQEMSAREIEDCAECSVTQIHIYEKNEMIFHALDEPTSVYVLIEGDVLVCKDTLSGKRDIFSHVSKRGDVFGEVYLFMEKPVYEYYAIPLQRTTVMEIPKSFFYRTCEKDCEHHTKLIRNMLKILAQKAFRFNQKLQILASGTLRQKIIRYLLENRNGDRTVTMTMSREMFADYLNVARPSLSRELLKMQADELIRLKGRKITILDAEELEACL